MHQPQEAQKELVAQYKYQTQGLFQVQELETQEQNSANQHQEYLLQQSGIPTVVETAVLVNDCLDLLIEKLQNEAKSNDTLNKLKEEDNYEEIKEALIPNDYNLIVTPKEIDDLIENMKDIVASGINMSL